LNLRSQLADLSLVLVSKCPVSDRGQAQPVKEDHESQRTGPCRWTDEKKAASTASAFSFSPLPSPPPPFPLSLSLSSIFSPFFVSLEPDSPSHFAIPLDSSLLIWNPQTQRHDPFVDQCSRTIPEAMVRLCLSKSHLPPVQPPRTAADGPSASRPLRPLKTLGAMSVPGYSAARQRLTVSGQDPAAREVHGCLERAVIRRIPSYPQLSLRTATSREGKGTSQARQGRLLDSGTNFYACCEGQADLCPLYLISD